MAEGSSMLVAYVSYQTRITYMRMPLMASVLSSTTWWSISSFRYCRGGVKVEVNGEGEGKSWGLG